MKQNEPTAVMIRALISTTSTLSSLNLPFSSSSTTNRELLSQFSICSEWRWLIEVGEKKKKNVMQKPPVFRKLYHFSEMQNDAMMHREDSKG